MFTVGSIRTRSDPQGWVAERSGSDPRLKGKMSYSPGPRLKSIWVSWTPSKSKKIRLSLEKKLNIELNQCDFDEFDLKIH